MGDELGAGPIVRRPCQAEYPPKRWRLSWCSSGNEPDLIQFRRRGVAAALSENPRVRANAGTLAIKREFDVVRSLMRSGRARSRDDPLVANPKAVAGVAGSPLRTAGGWLHAANAGLNAAK